MIEPADMLLFVAVVREGSFTAAAATLGITKQSVSERVNRLEQRLGVRLLERTTRSLRVTDAGARYYERCALISVQIEEANREVQRVQAEPVGLLRVSAPVLYGRRFLAPVIGDFLHGDQFRSAHGDRNGAEFTPVMRPATAATGIDGPASDGEFDVLDGQRTPHCASPLCVACMPVR